MRDDHDAATRLDALARPHGAGSAGTLLARLREHTAMQHRAVEAVMDIQSFADRERYGRVLGRLHGFHAAFERGIDAIAAPPALDVPGRRKLAWLHSDLCALGWSAREIAALPLCDGWVAPASVGALVGALYVTEGATLGGQVICRALTRMHAHRPVPMAYFTSYGDDVGRAWQRFCAVAETLVPDAASRDEACAQAAQTFDAFGAWLSAENANVPAAQAAVAR